MSKTKSGKFYISILIQQDSDCPIKTTISHSKIQAFDMSFPKFLVSTQEDFHNPRFYRKEEKTLQRLHHRLSRKIVGSKNRNKTRIRLARKYDQIYNRKNDWTHKISHKLANEYDAVILEDLNIEGMKKFRKGYSKSATLDFSWNKFVNTLRYKLEQQGKHLILVDRWFPSSKQCSHCGNKNKELKLSERIWTCKNCGSIHNRDKNASKNLLIEGYKQLKMQNVSIISTVGTTGSHAREDDVRYPLDTVVDEPRIHCH